MTVLPNTDTDMVNELVTTEFGISSYNAYQVKNTSPYVYGETFEGDTVTEDFKAAAAAEEAPVVAPAEETVTVPGVVADVEHAIDVVAKDAEAEAEKVEEEVVAEAEKVPGFAERILHDIEGS